MTRIPKAWALCAVFAIVWTGCGPDEPQERTVVPENDDRVEIQADGEGFEVDIGVGEDGGVRGEVEVRDRDGDR